MSRYGFSDTAEPANSDRLGHPNPAMPLRVCAYAVESADQLLATALAATPDGRPETPAPDGESVERSKGMDVLPRLGADRQAVSDFCRRNGVRRLVVFGSALRDDFTPASDVDLRSAGDLGSRFRDQVVAEAEAVSDVAP